MQQNISLYFSSSAPEALACFQLALSVTKILKMDAEDIHNHCYYTALYFFFLLTEFESQAHSGNAYKHIELVNKLYGAKVLTTKECLTPMLSQYAWKFNYLAP